jgi:hypothetical protein
MKRAILTGLVGVALVSPAMAKVDVHPVKTLPPEMQGTWCYATSTDGVDDDGRGYAAYKRSSKNTGNCITLSANGKEGCDVTGVGTAYVVACEDKKTRYQIAKDGLLEAAEVSDLMPRWLHVQGTWCFQHGGPRKEEGDFIAWYGDDCTRRDRKDLLILNDGWMMSRDGYSKTGWMCKLSNWNSGTADAECSGGGRKWHELMSFGGDHEGPDDNTPHRLTVTMQHKRW